MTQSTSLTTGTAIGVVLSLITACAEMAPRAGQSTTVNFGTVRSAEKVTLNSTTVEGALIGGTLGVMFGRGSSRAGTGALGAAAGGAIGAAAGGDRTGMDFTVEMRDGSSTRIVSDQREIHVGDCVAIERVRDSANIRRVAAGFCEPAYATAAQDLEADVRDDAVKCERAKQALADADTNESAEIAIRKVELLCNS